MPFDTKSTDFTPAKVASARWESKQKHYSLRLSPSLWDKLETKAHSKGMSINNYIIDLIEKDTK